MTTPHFGPGLVEVKQAGSAVGYGWIRQVSSTRRAQHWVFGPGYAAPNTASTLFLPKDGTSLGIVDLDSFFDAMEALWGGASGARTVHGDAIVQSLPADPGSAELDFGTVQILDGNGQKVGELYADGNPASHAHWVTHGTTVGWNPSTQQNQALVLQPVSGLGYKSLEAFIHAMWEYLDDKGPPHRYEVEEMSRVAGVDRP